MPYAIPDPKHPGYSVLVSKLTLFGKEVYASSTPLPEAELTPFSKHSINCPKTQQLFIKKLTTLEAERELEEHEELEQETPSSENMSPSP